MNYEETVAEINVLIDDIAAMLPAEGTEPTEFEAKVAQLLNRQAAMLEMMAQAEAEAASEGETMASEAEDIGEDVAA